MKITKKDIKIKPTLKVKKDPRTGESSLKKAVKNVKKILKKDIQAKSHVEKAIKTVSKKAIKSKNESQDFIKVQGLKKKKQIKKDSTKSAHSFVRGLIYVGHIPHGFYEEQMKQFFSQFGKVTRVRVNRSAKTGRSKGYGFVEFLHTEVAKIAAESMNNYLMCGRLVKSEYIPPEKQRDDYFIGPDWSVVGHPAQKRRRKTIRLQNAPKANSLHPTFVKNSVKNLSKVSQLLRNEGLDFKMKLGKVEI